MYSEVWVGGSVVADVPVVRASRSSVMYSSRSEIRVDEDSDGGTTATDKLSSFAGLTLTLSPATNHIEISDLRIYELGKD